MAIEILSEKEIACMRRAGRAAARTLSAVGLRLRAGVSTAEIDRWVREDTNGRGATPSQLGYEGFPAAVCTSANHIVCHGVPRHDDVLRSGDIINVDVTSKLDGYHGDTSVTFEIGEVDGVRRHVCDVALRCLHAGIGVVREGARLGDIGAAIDDLARAEGCGVVEAFGGHGIGRHMHQDPHVPHVGTRGRGLRLAAGMALTIEPMLTIGAPRLQILDDGWTVVTEDGSPSAQFEHTVLVTRSGAEVLTQSDDPIRLVLGSDAPPQAICGRQARYRTNRPGS
ncbi:MAG: type I methionyl aminopeptidase [Nannocystaceae bacterium]